MSGQTTILVIGPRNPAKCGAKKTKAAEKLRAGGNGAIAFWTARQLARFAADRLAEREAAASGGGGAAGADA